MFVKLTASIALGSNCTVEATIFDLVDCNNPAQMKQMSQALKTLIQGDVSKQLSVTPSSQTTFGKTGKVGANNGKSITPKQLDTIRGLLPVINMNEADYCRQHRIERLEQMPLEEARSSIREMYKIKDGLRN